MSISIPDGYPPPYPVPPKSKDLPAPSMSHPATAPALQAASVSISGRALLMARLFAGQLNEPPVSHSSTWLNAIDPLPFLTKMDREMMADVYEFASGQGVDLAYVDELAGNLALYRLHNNGQRILPQAPGMSFDSEGHEVTYLFTDKNAATAARILQSEAFQSTRFDTGFLRNALDAKHSALHYLNFDFVEQMVNKFSSVGTVVEDVGSRFSHFQPNQKNWVKHLSTEVYDLKTRLPRNTASTSEKNGQTTGPSSPGTANVSENTPLTLRQAIHKYLQQNAIPTLFQAIARLRR